MYKFLSSLFLFTCFALLLWVGGWGWQLSRAQQPRPPARQPSHTRQPPHARTTPSPASSPGQQRPTQTIKTAGNSVLLIKQAVEWIKKPYKDHPARHFSQLQALLQQDISTSALAQAVSPYLQHKQWQVRQKAAYTLSLASELLRRARVVEQLRTMATKDLHWKVRVQAVRALGLVGPRHKKQMKQTLLHSLHHDRYWQVRAQAAHTLGQLGEGPLPATEVLRKALSDPSWQVRAATASMLLQVEPLHPSLAKALGKSLADREPAVRHAAAYTLERMGADAVPVLIQAARSRQEAVRQQAHTALASHKKHIQQVLRALRQDLRHKDWRVAESAAAALSRMGRYATPAVPELSRLLQHPKSALQRMASWALQQIGVAALPALRKLLQHPKVGVKVIAAETIGLLGPPAASSAPSLVDALLDKSWRVRREAAWALYRMGPRAGKYIPMSMIPVLINSFQDKQWSVRYGIAHVLGWMGPRGRMVIGWFGRRAVSTTGVLRELSKNDPKPRVRRAARQALYRVTAKTY